jgi:hypothetical protein
MTSAYQFIYVGDKVQIAYASGRDALAEWWFTGSRWRLAGYLYEGNVRSLADANRLCAEYLRIHNGGDL